MESRTNTMFNAIAVLRPSHDLIGRRYDIVCLHVHVHGRRGAFAPGVVGAQGVQLLLPFLEALLLYQGFAPQLVVGQLQAVPVRLLALPIREPLSFGGRQRAPPITGAYGGMRNTLAR